MKIFVFVLAVFVLVPFQAWAATYYVAATGGSDARSCPGAQSISTPKQTIAAGIACLASGDTLNIRAGTYNEAISETQFGGKSGSSYATATTIRAYQTDVVTLTQGISFPGNLTTSYIVFQADPVAHNFILTGVGIGVGQAGLKGSANHIKFDGLEVKNITTGAGIPAAIQMGEAGNDALWFTHMKVHDNTDYTGGCNSGGPAHGFYVQVGNTIIEYTEIFNIYGQGIQNYDQVGGRASNNIYRFNTIHDSATGAGSPPCTPPAVFGIGISPSSNNQVYDNLVYNNGGGIGANGTTGTLIYNNTVYHNGQNGLQPGCCYPGINATNIPGLMVRNNISYNNSAGEIDTTGSSGTFTPNATSNPGFVSTTPGDPNFLKINASSTAAYNQGADLGGSYAVDIAGVTRPQLGGWDIGAYEFTSGATLPVVTINVPAVGAVVSATPTTVSGTSSLP